MRAGLEEGGEGGRGVEERAREWSLPEWWIDRALQDVLFDAGRVTGGLEEEGGGEERETEGRNGRKKRGWCR